ncbi:MAG: hypothetical protein KatS3mg109_0931 [Pirellulaceae bacterium]|nr:MAG: hypothetical protein KatS3mg109_0931 [Pirellulaceae bacterium]
MGRAPAGFNEPTAEGVKGSEAILRLVQEASPADGCICLLSGGASALLPAPVPEVALEEKLHLTRYLSAQGANIQQLNTVRKHLSRIKGGRLAAACRAGWLVTLIISDVLGDPLDVIGSGPTVPDSSTPAEALAILEQFRAATIAPSAWRYLQRIAQQRRPSQAPTCCTLQLVIGNNATAVEAAGEEAIRRGYHVAMVSSSTLEGPAESVGSHLAKMAVRMRQQPGPNCLVSGGEPVVKLAPPEKRGLGGRNQQLVLAALCQLWGILPPESPDSATGGSQHTAGRTRSAGRRLTGFRFLPRDRGAQRWYRR